MNTEPLAFYITWTVYGTFLQGDPRGWRRRGEGSQTPQPLLAKWHQSRLRHPVKLLTPLMRDAVELECRRHCLHRQWHCWELSARSTHVHAVISAYGFNGAQVRDQLKANCTRMLRERWDHFLGRPVWSVGGDWQTIYDEQALHEVITYVREAQDRKGREA